MRETKRLSVQSRHDLKVMPEKIAFSQYSPRFHAETDMRACADELEREYATRKRLYDRWVAEGKCTWQEAHDRMRRIMGAMRAVRELIPKDAVLEVEASATPF